MPLRTTKKEENKNNESLGTKSSNCGKAIYTINIYFSATFAMSFMKTQ
jgi:hypothetical protein